MAIAAEERPTSPIPAVRPPSVRIGRTRRDGIAPSIFALVERGALKRPALAASIEGCVAIRFRDGFGAVTISFAPDGIVIEDVDAARPDVVVAAGLADVVLLTTAPLRMGLPSPTNGRGRAVLGKMATGRIRLAGDMGLARQLLELMRIDVPPAAERKPARPKRPQPTGGRYLDVLT